MAKAVFKKVLLYSEILAEHYVDIVFEKDGKIYRGALFFELDLDEKYVYEHVTENVETETDEELVERAIAFYQEWYDNTYSTTADTMKHWQYMNGFTEQIMK